MSIRRRQARAIRRALKAQRVAMLRRLRALLGSRVAREGGTEALRSRVIGVLDAHPDGIGVREIGNELGIDWRTVAALMSGLVARGAADQIDQDFFPNGARRKC